MVGIGEADGVDKHSDKAIAIREKSVRTAFRRTKLTAQTRKPVLGPDSAGVRMTPEEFDAIEDWDENYRYELIHGVLVVSPPPLDAEVGQNEMLGHWLLRRGRLLDVTNQVPIDIVLTGQHPGRYGSSPIAYPDPATAAEAINGVRYIQLVWLIQLKLAARRHRDLGDVAALIRVHNLDESFQEKLHASVHRAFVECLEECRRELEYEAREGL